ncbi:MAG: VOC family protein [Pseudomonadota bacterium]
MQKVQGIGGVFFRAKDPAALAKWYDTHLGVSQTPTEADTAPWMQEAGPTVFAPFAQDTDYFGDDSKSTMFNFRVADLAAMIDQLTAAGIDVKRSEEMEGVGSFARLTDPEGNPIELWQPAAMPAP